MALSAMYSVWKSQDSSPVTMMVPIKMCVNGDFSPESNCTQCRVSGRDPGEEGILAAR